MGAARLILLMGWKARGSSVPNPSSHFNPLLLIAPKGERNPSARLRLYAKNSDSSLVAMAEGHLKEEGDGP